MEASPMALRQQCKLPGQTGTQQEPIRDDAREEFQMGSGTKGLGQ